MEIEANHGDLFEYLEETNDDDVPDSQWFDDRVRAVERYNEKLGARFDPRDSVIAWIKQR